MISKQKLATHFQGHFSNRDQLVNPDQPEITNPENFLHVLPPPDQLTSLPHNNLRSNESRTNLTTASVRAPTK